MTAELPALRHGSASPPANTGGGSVGRSAPGGVRLPRATLVIALLAGVAYYLSSGAPAVEEAGIAAAAVSVRAVADDAPLRPLAPLEPAAADQPSRGPAVFAHYEGVPLHEPAAHVILVGYHEASFPDALPVQPLGTPVANHNRGKLGTPDARDGPVYVIMSSRGRPNPATSAADVAVSSGEPVLSVATGMVVSVEPYLLYGRHPDVRLELVPDGRADLRVVMIHLSDVRVQVGDRVRGGETVVAGSANQFPFFSQVDEYTSEHAGVARGPHVHVEVKVAPPDGRGRLPEMALP